jgi:hypothetical protein
VREVLSTLPQASVAVHDSSTSPPQALGIGPKVEVAVPLIPQLPVKPLLYESVEVVASPHATVISDTAANVVAGAGLTWIVLDAVSTLPQASVAVHDSVTSPPQALGIGPKVEVAVPLMPQLPVKPLLYNNELVLALPHGTVISDTLWNVAAGAGLTCIVREVLSTLPQASVAVHDSVTSPPQALGIGPKVEVAVPLIPQLPVKPLLYESELVLALPHATVISLADAKVAAGAGLTWIVREVLSTLPQASVAIHDSVTSPPQAAGIEPKVDVAVPLIPQLPVKPLLYESELVLALPHATVILDTAAKVAAGGGRKLMC